MGQKKGRRRQRQDSPVELPKNFTRASLFLLLKEEPCHGYDLLMRLRDLGFRGADAGGLYRTLRAMEQEGLVRSKWESSGIGPARRIYELTQEGEDWLHLSASTLRHTGELVTRYLKRYEAVTKDDRAIPAGLERQAPQ